MTAPMTALPTTAIPPAQLRFELYEADNETPVEGVVWTGMNATVKLRADNATIDSECSFDLPFDDWRLEEIKKPGRLVRVSVRNAEGEWEPWEAFVPRFVNATAIPAKGEPRTTTIRCVSRVAAMGNPGGLVGLRPGTERFAGALDKRLFGWQCPEFDVSSWATQVVGNQLYNPIPPVGWYSPFTKWITCPDAANGDTFLAVYDFTLSAPKILVPRRTAVGGCRVWLNGVPIGDTPLPSNGSKSNAKEKTYRWPVACDAGDYRLAVEVIGPLDAKPELAFEMYAVDDTETGICNVDTFLFQTDDVEDFAWKVFRVTGDTRPGLTPGQILGKHVDEMQSDGLLAGVTKGFSAGLDGQTVAWDQTQTLITDTGKSTPEFLSQLAASEIDAFMSPEGNTLYAVRWRERGDFHNEPTDAPKLIGGRAQPYGLVEGQAGNLMSHGWEQALVPETVRWRVRYRDGYADVGGSGPYYYADLGDVDREAAVGLANALMTARTDRAVTIRSAVLTDWIGPSGTFLGDAISVPFGQDGTWTNYRLMAIELTSDEAGNATVALELSSPLVEAQVALDRRIARLRAGVSAESITAPDKFGTDIEGGEWRAERMEFSKDGRVNEGSLISQRYPFPPDRRRLNQFTATLREVDPTYHIWFRLLIDGTPVHLAEMAPGEEKTADGDGWIGPHHGQQPAMLQVEFVDGANNDDGFLPDWTAEGFGLVIEHGPAL